MPLNETKKINISGIDETFKERIKSSFFSKVKFFALPLFLLVISLGLVFFEILPRITAIQQEDQNQNFYKQNIQDYKTDITNLSNGSNLNISSNLNLLNSWVPSTVGNISSLEGEFSALSDNYNLSLKDFRAGESITKATQDLLKTLQLTENSEVLRNTPIEFNVSGELENIMKFIDNIQHYNTFNAFKSLKISTIAGNWNAKLVLVRYNFSENFKVDTTKQAVTTIDQTFVTNLQDRAKLN